MSRPTKFQSGDMAALLSGGPVMTVFVAYDLDVECVWFDNDQQVHAHTFAEWMLRKVETNVD
jgi:uncharacterized protein YodC (DUF2158 family)